MDAGSAAARVTANLKCEHEGMPDTGVVVAVAQLALVVGNLDVNRQVARSAIASTARSKRNVQSPGARSTTACCARSATTAGGTPGSSGTKRKAASAAARVG